MLGLEWDYCKYFVFYQYFIGTFQQRWKKYFSFCHPGIIVQYFLLLSRNFEWGLCTYILNNLMISVLLKRYYSKMSIKSWFCIFLLDYRWNITCFFYVLEIFSAKFWFWKYFLSSRMTGFTTFSTSGNMRHKRLFLTKKCLFL